MHIHGHMHTCCYNICFGALDEWSSFPIRSLGVPTRALRCCCLALESGVFVPPARQYIFGAHVKVVFVSRTLGGNIIVDIIFQEVL
jgi:hypothetical protein